MGFILCGKGNWSSPIQNLVQTESANEMAKADDKNLSKEVAVISLVLRLVNSIEMCYHNLNYFCTILKIKFKSC